MGFEKLRIEHAEMGNVPLFAAAAGPLVPGVS
jgi:hypothetical protein